MCVYDEHPLASQDTVSSNQELVKYQATKSWSEYKTTQQVRACRNIQPMTQSGKVNYVILNQNDSCNCVTYVKIRTFNILNTPILPYL